MIVTQALRFLLIGAGTLAAVSSSSAALAQDRRPAAIPDASRPVERIAAVVNEDAISVLDLKARLRLALLSSGLPDTPDTRQRLGPQVLRSLIDEKLQIQESKRLGVSVTEQELDTALAHVAEQNHMQRAGLEKLLEQRKVPLSSLVGQIRANIAWTKLIQRKLRPTIQIGDEEIDGTLDKLRTNIGKPEYLAAEIFLAVDQPSHEGEVRQLADRLVDEIRKGTAFPAVARQFSQAAGAGNGGDLGWIQPGQLPEELDRILVTMRPGQLSAPIRDASGYHILLIRDQRTLNGGDARETKVHLKQLVLPIGAHGDRKTQLARAAALGERIKSCAALDEELRAAGQEKVGDVGSVRAGDLPPELGRLVNELPIGQLSPPFGNDRQIMVIAVCERKAANGGLPTREAIATSLSNERLDMLQRRYLIDLKRAAYVDVRM